MSVSVCLLHHDRVQLTFNGLLPGRSVDGHEVAAHAPARGVGLALGHGRLHQLQTHSPLRVGEGTPGVGTNVAWRRSRALWVLVA